MCIVSNIGDYGRKTWPGPWYNPNATPLPVTPAPPPYTGPTREQFEEFLKLMRAARQFDKVAGQPDCPADDKIAWMRGLAKHLGIDPTEVADALK